MLGYVLVERTILAVNLKIAEFIRLVLFQFSCSDIQLLFISICIWSCWCSFRVPGISSAFVQHIIYYWMCSRKALYYCNALCHVYMCAKQGRAIIKNCLTLNCVIWNSSTLSHVFCYVKLYFMSKINLQFNKKFRVICPSLIQSHIHATYMYMFHIYINSHIVHKLNHFNADVIRTYVHTYILC